MFFKTRLSRSLTETFSHLKIKALTVQTTFSLALFFLFVGFLCGNLFGTFLDTLRLYFFWNGLVGLLILFFVEIINFLVYGFLLSKRIGYVLYQPNQTPINKPKFYETNRTNSNKILYLERILNAFKIGLLFGFFVDSFKVGS